jgi:lipopolysaccharide/colanic/teichoic acid biosynthesis glycosyltransferase
MLKNSPNMGTGDITTRNDPRVLPVGRFLRKTKINELPQLVNIFIGDMSVVGPRPLTRNNYNAYSDDVRACISRMTPGLSGVGSIVFRDEEAYVSRSSNPVAYYNERIAPVKGALEKWYFANRSLYVDAMVILLTVWAVVNPKSDLIYSVFPDLPRMETE